MSAVFVTFLSRNHIVGYVVKMDNQLNQCKLLSIPLLSSVFLEKQSRTSAGL